MTDQPNLKFLPPSCLEGGTQLLHLESTLQELSLYKFEVDVTCLTREVAQVFEKHPLLPGVILLEDGQFLGMLSRRRLLEYLIHPHGLELFLNSSLVILYSYARIEPLLLSESTPVLLAAQQVLRRSPEIAGEPIVVQTSRQGYRLLDVYELNVAYWQIRGIETQVRYERTQAQMIQSDKMASLGRLVDGLAHEILDPVSFIWGNLTHVATYSQDLMKLVAAYEAYFPNVPDEIKDLKAEIEFNFLQQDLPHAIESIKTGAERLTKLTASLQNFCHIDEVYPKPADIHELLNNIVLLLKNRLTSDIQIVKNYGHLPPVVCYAGQLEQVFMNILINAVDVLIDPAVRQKMKPEFRNPTLNPEQENLHQPRIEITTKVCSLNSPTSSTPSNRWVAIFIADNGHGMSPELQKQILESFSIKKRAAKETSLSVSYQIITAKHGGKLNLRSPWIPEGKSEAITGTEFEILLPLG
ncbi:MAG: ATP-binding protein [Leptolyngbyaceae bacterium]|nr:ATP-binding protein [Leptolyngbyaceae bacterium]